MRNARYAIKFKLQAHAIRAAKLAPMQAPTTTASPIIAQTLFAPLAIMMQTLRTPISAQAALTTLQSLMDRMVIAGATLAIITTKHRTLAYSATPTATPVKDQGQTSVIDVLTIVLFGTLSVLQTAKSLVILSTKLTFTVLMLGHVSLAMTSTTQQTG